MITLERPMNYKSLVYGLSVKTFLFLPSLPWKVWEPFKVLLLPTTIRATIRALPSAHYHPRTYVNTEGVTGVQFPPILGPATQTQGNSLQVSLGISGVPTCIDRCKGHQYVKNQWFQIFFLFLNANNFWGRTDWSILLHLWEKLHHNIIDKLSNPPQIWPQIHGTILRANQESFFYCVQPAAW